MPRKSPLLEIAEVSGNRYPDLETAQRLALESMAGCLADMLRGLLATGILTLEDGCIVVPPSQKGDSENDT